MNSKDQDQFDSLQYWRSRHEQYLSDPRGVGNVVFDRAENEKIYEEADGYIYELITNLDRKGPVKVLDLGCGIGMLADAFIRKGCDYTGIDISEKAIEIARRKHPQGTFEVGNIGYLPLETKFDIIIERTVFIHLVEDNYWKAVIGEAKRLLDKDGIFILHDHIPIAPGKNLGVDHVKIRLYSEYEKVFQECDLKFDVQMKHALAEKMSISENTHFATHMNI